MRIWVAGVGSLAVLAMLVFGWAGPSAVTKKKPLTPAQRFARGTVPELQFASRQLADSGRTCWEASQTLIEAQLWFEYGILPEETRSQASDVELVDVTCLDEAVAIGLLAFAAGERERVDQSIARARELASIADPEQTLAPGHVHWLIGMVALTSNEAAARQAAIGGLAEASSANPDALALLRMQANLYLRGGDGRRALEILAAARKQATHHMGLAADEALANAVMRQQASGVADLTDQLLEYGPEVLSPPDRARTLVARAIVHVHMGERDVGLGKLERAWALIPNWDQSARYAALELSLEAGDTARLRDWLRDPQVHLQADDRAIFEAWAMLGDGQLRDALAALAKLPQEHPRVAYLQGLALVEQRRMEEAVAWLKRAQNLLPRRVELEVALARASVVTGDRKQALRRLQGLAEEEPFAPRARTGLGEAYLAQGDDPEMLGRAHQALLAAVDHERLPAEAMMQLAELWRRQRVNVPEGDTKAREWLERATQTNPHVPRYHLELALHLVG
ncbi:MAG: tetratricopeptide repeat protein, partial [Nannocystaceae bacterium]